MAIQDDIEQVNVKLPEFQKELFSQVQVVMNEMEKLNSFLEIWKKAIGEENIAKIQVKEKNNGII